MVPFLPIRSPAGSLCKIESRWYQVRENCMHAVAAAGPNVSGAVPIILVHGLGVSGSYMKPLAERLGAYHPTYAPDLPGFGRSSKPATVYSLARLADALADWMAAAQIEKPVLVGNSFGCQIIVEFAVRHPARLSAIVLQGPTIDVAARSFFSQGWRFVNVIYREPVGLIPVALSDYWKAGLRRILSTYRVALADPIESKLEWIRKPALVIRGEKDPVSPEAWTRELSRRLPEGRHLVLPGTHALVFSDPEPLAGVIRRFILETVEF